jgi:hypothetical protein
MKAYVNRFIVDDEHNSLLVTFDLCVAFIFQQLEWNEDDMSIKSNILGH